MYYDVGIIQSVIVNDFVFVLCHLVTYYDTFYRFDYAENFVDY